MNASEGGDMMREAVLDSEIPRRATEQSHAFATRVPLPRLRVCGCVNNFVYFETQASSKQLGPEYPHL